MNGTSWLLGAGYPWYSGTAGAEEPGSSRSAVVANSAIGLSLATLPTGPLGLAAEDDSLGRLTLPRGITIDGDTVYILSDDGSLVYRYDPVLATLVPLAHVGAQGLSADADDSAYLEPRRFRGASNIAAVGGQLYVADPAARRVQVFDLRTLALLRIHKHLIDPIDVAASPRAAYVLDRGAGRVYRAEPATDRLSVVVDPVDLDCRPRRWDRLAIDDQERIYLRYRSCETTELDVFTTCGCASVSHRCDRVYDSAQVRDRFAQPAVTTDAAGGFDLPERLLDPCKLRRPLADSVPRWEIDDRLYVADAESRTLIVYLADGRARHRFGPFDADGIEVPKDSASAWSPVEIISLGGCAVILDARHQIVYAHRKGDSQLRQWFAAAADSNSRWRRIAADTGGCLLLWDGFGDEAERFDTHGKQLGSVPVRNVKALFDRPKSTRQPSTNTQRIRLTRAGVVPRPDKEPPSWPADSHERTGTWTSQWLDSDLYNCVWHVIELSVARMPPGSSILVRTRTSNATQTLAQVRASAGAVNAGSWRETRALVAAAQPDPDLPETSTYDMLVPSPPGQHLQLQIVLQGNGTSTPLIRHARLRFPRESLLQYLPAIYSSPPQQQDFLDRFLSIAQTTWTAIEQEVDTFARHLDPDSAPDNALAYLAGWLDVRLEGTWTPDQNRQLLKAMPGLRTRWGTLEGMRDWLRVYLANLAGLSVDDLDRLGVPGIVESFIDRRRLRLAGGGATLCQAHALWSPAVERRFQVDVYDRLGEVELVSTGDPELDVFQHYAHSFRVYVPSSLIRTPEHEALIRRAIELQKPAHAIYELVLVEPRIRIGDQSTLDLDTVIGAPLPSALSCASDTRPPGQPPHQRLGFDTTLGCGADDHRLERGLA